LHARTDRAPRSTPTYASWHIKFATNRLGLAYTPKSKYANDINADNWYTIIARADVKLGLADPRFDAVGYRQLMALQLAKAAYNEPTILEDVTLGQFKTPITLEPANGRAVIHVPEILETKKDANIILRGASIQLIQAGIYRRGHCLRLDDSEQRRASPASRRFYHVHVGTQGQGDYGCALPSACYARPRR